MHGRISRHWYTACSNLTRRSAARSQDDPTTCNLVCNSVSLVPRSISTITSAHYHGDITRSESSVKVAIQFKPISLCLCAEVIDHLSATGQRPIFLLSSRKVLSVWDVINFDAYARTRRSPAKRAPDGSPRRKPGEWGWICIRLSPGGGGRSKCLCCPGRKIFGDLHDARHCGR